MPDAFPLIAQQAMRLSTGYDWFMLASRILHVLGAIILVGGVFYLWAVVTPALNTVQAESSQSVDRFFGGSRAAWAKWIGIASALLLVTGLWNFIQMVKTNHIHVTYHMLGALKIVLGLVLMFLAAVLAGRTAMAESIRQKWRAWLIATLVLGILVVGLGSLMRTYNRTPKIDNADGPALIAP